MKLKYISVATLAVGSLLLSSCAFSPGDSYGTFSYSTNGYDSSISWTSASYDANGFPIFGYSYGRPVYGYTQAGAAIFTIAALTALSYVPKWKPAPWYKGHWHYPAQVHRVPAPPRFPAGHRPGMRPPGGMNAAIHRAPGAGLKPRPARMAGAAPQPRPTVAAKPAPKPALGNKRPNGGKPDMENRPANRPSFTIRPDGSRPDGNHSGLERQSGHEHRHPMSFNRPGGNDHPDNAPKGR